MSHQQKVSQMPLQHLPDRHASSGASRRSATPRSGTCARQTRRGQGRVALPTSRLQVLQFVVTGLHHACFTQLLVEKQVFLPESRCTLHAFPDSSGSTLHGRHYFKSYAVFGVEGVRRGDSESKKLTTHKRCASSIVFVCPVFQVNR